MMDEATTTEFLRGLRQSRSYTDEAVSDDDLRAILTVAQWTGSAMNRQPWELVVLRDPARIAALAALDRYIAFCGGAPVVILLAMHGATIDEHAFDEGRLCERILLAAEARGLGSGVGWLHGDAVAGVRDMVQLPADRVIRSIIAIGHAAPTPPDRKRPAQPRRPLGELVHAEVYGAHDGM